MQDLTVISESVQRIFNYYLEKRLIVNRRYQRKLVWTIEEKEAFIDSIIKNYPVPLILLADNANDDKFEIIDGMQRLNAVCSFIENEFSVDGEYFDLETMAETKLLKDENVLTQREPVMDRKKCSEFTAYVIPLSTYRGASEAEIDEVFRRINANGKHLSRQEIRQAGEISSFAELVKKIASEIRGDASLRNRLELNSMKIISITSRRLEYGINVDDVFWVKNQIIRREQVRESKDEEIIADIVATMLLEDVPGSSSKILDEYYGLSNQNKRALELDSRLNIYSAEMVYNDFISVFDIIKSILQTSNSNFNSLITEDRSFEKVPRYFQIIFLALYRLLIKDSKKLTSLNNLIDSLNGITSSIRLSQGGGNWSAIERETSINAVVGIISKHFVDNPEDPAIVKWSTQLETILQQSKTEQTNFDFKISFHDISTGKWNDDCFEKIIQTLTAMANSGKESIGYVIVGVADKYKDAEYLKSKDSSYDAIEYRGFYITGINYDIDKYGKGEDKFYQFIVNKIRTMTCIEDNYKNCILSNIKFLRYADRMVLIFKVKGLDKPAIFNDKYYQRSGANIQEIQMKDIMSLMQRFN